MFKLFLSRRVSAVVAVPAVVLASMVNFVPVAMAQPNPVANVAAYRVTVEAQANIDMLWYCHHRVEKKWKCSNPYDVPQQCQANFNSMHWECVGSYIQWRPSILSIILTTLGVGSIKQKVCVLGLVYTNFPVRQLHARVHCHLI